MRVVVPLEAGQIDGCCDDARVQGRGGGPPLGEQSDVGTGGGRLVALLDGDRDESFAALADLRLDGGRVILLTPRTRAG